MPIMTRNEMKWMNEWMKEWHVSFSRGHALMQWKRYKHRDGVREL